MLKADCVERYFGGLSKASIRNRKLYLESFFRFVGVGPEEAVRFQRLNPLSYRFVDASYEWVNDRGLRVSSQETMISCVRGFFLANRCPLPQDRHRFRSEKVPVVGELSVEEFRKIVVASNLTYRAAYLMMFQSGSGVGELIYINTKLASHVWDEVRRGKQIICLTMPGRKTYRNIRPYVTFVGGDAVDALKALFHSRGWKKDSVLFRTSRGDSLTRQGLQGYFKRKALQLGFIKRKTPACLDCGAETVRRRVSNKREDRVYYVCVECPSSRPCSDYNLSLSELAGVRYRMRTHEIRDLFRTEWHRSGVDAAVGEEMMGHTIDALEYDKIMRDRKYVLAMYRKALPFLNILSEDPRKVDRSEIDARHEALNVEVEVLRGELAKARKDIERIEQLGELWRKEIEKE